MDRVLVVDDDQTYLEAIKMFLEEQGFVVDIATGGDEAVEKVKQNPFGFAVVLIDFKMKGKNGAEVTRELRTLNPNLFIVMFSGDESREVVKRSYEAGINWFVDKAPDKALLLSEIRRWCRKYHETFKPVDASSNKNEFQKITESVGMAGCSEKIAVVANFVLSVRGKRGNVLLLGETGTGKEVTANAIHNGNGKFVPLNCGQHRANPTLLDAKLFGQVKGAFTGATENKKGVFEEADGGTVFLDEIHRLVPDSQVGLLRVLQEKKVSRLGDTKETLVKFRLICAAKPDLLEEVKRGNFREDLYYRIKGSACELPPLRERPEDIEPLVHRFCQLWSKASGIEKTFLLRTIPLLKLYNWPGNVRELQNLVYDLFDRLPHNQIGPDDLDPRFYPEKAETLAVPLKEFIKEAEKEHLEKTYDRSASLRVNAKKFGISAAALLKRVNKYGIKINTQHGKGEL